MKYLKLIFNIMVVIICSFILFLIDTLPEEINETIDFWKEDNSNKERKCQK